MDEMDLPLSPRAEAALDRLAAHHGITPGQAAHQAFCLVVLDGLAQGAQHRATGLARAAKRRRGAQDAHLLRQEEAERSAALGKAAAATLGPYEGFAAGLPGERAKDWRVVRKEVVRFVRENKEEVVRAVAGDEP